MYILAAVMMGGSFGYMSGQVFDDHITAMIVSITFGLGTGFLAGLIGSK